MAQIQLKQVEKRFGEFQAVQPMDLTINNGEFVVLLGPSGCGKTTTLRMISGLEAVTGGKIFIGDRDVTWRNPSDRDIAFVFQLYALYPHMTVEQNIIFPLEAQKESKERIRRRLKHVVDLLQIKHLLPQKPGSLSGGDKQRVALGRALVRKPSVFLMDEPLGALDADFRETMRAEIKKLHIAEQATTVYVTHDQVEAMAMGDRIVVMSDAVVQQVGSPDDVYYDPANLFVARFIGSPGMNLIEGTYGEGVVYLAGDNQYEVPHSWRPAIEQQLSGEGIIVGFRPEAAKANGVGQLGAEVYASDLHGAFNMMHVALEKDNVDVVVHIRGERGASHEMGDTLRFDVQPEMVRFFDPQTEKAIVNDAEAAV
ncbi:MAG: ABC transporter ATP-binding protein [Candidatus Promineifilaceae bacterium]|nr:ABC transporter ATP-binding protein [Candidatus Promineifilaceae bacterium]